ncbi:acyltransferase family protein [Erwinia pyrifoliae]|uniref:acyltransferase family protein n=1 Tax=Erwinia pyrifoliae TaxID=79967 RepID=UPI0021F9EE5C|nr:acyltransferase [Erwinia pyrifoliae]UWS31107.1 acyltransferase [Erwinia pyrifoliae]
MENKLISLQWLRAVAVLLVVGWHVMVKANVLNITSEQYFAIGNAGVDLFFIISGFIMAYTLQKQDNGRVFFVKRLARIIPLYWFFSLTALIIYLYNPNMVNSHTEHTTILNSFTLFPIENHAMLIDVGWTLRYEFIFYSILSICLIFRKDTGLKLCSILLLAIPFTSYFFNQRGFYFDFLTNEILMGFSFGIIAYYVNRKIYIYSKSIITILLGLALLLTLENYTPHLHRTFKYGVPMLLILFGTLKLNQKGSNCISKVLSITGDASYSIYLSHMFTIGIAILASRKILLGTKFDYLFIPFSILASTIVGIVIFHYIEKPLLKLVKNTLRSYSNVYQ